MISDCTRSFTTDATFEDSLDGEFFEAIREDLGIRVPYSLPDRPETMVSLAHRLHDEYHPLFSEESEEFLSFRASTLR